ncbi:protein chibby homolog 1 [Condylostylus longicornis]|uniref:protein chibby homolog 1 n=1 Tax=Condylostylus longicornis TaxID=2530218 RepID=UPI00244E0BC6|nr:protein chibby homolog 1 [Condylostylus longicornis]
MPLFNRKFEIKPIPPRTQRCNIGCPPITEDLNDFKDITLNLNNKELKFIDGMWIYLNKKNDLDDIQKLNKKLKHIEEENNINQVKVEILLDLLTESVSEIDLLKHK